MAPKPKLDVKAGAKLATQLEGGEVVEPEVLEGLNDRQQVILRLKLRGLSGNAIASHMGVSATVISNELKTIREIKGAELESKTAIVHISDALSIYEEVEQTALAIMSDAQSDATTQLKAAQVVTSARDKHVKLLMDLGLLERVAAKTDMNVQFSVLEHLNADARKRVAATLIEGQLSALPEPLPPPEDAEYEDASQEAPTEED